jgi:hypothetical protein
MSDAPSDPNAPASPPGSLTTHANSSPPGNSNPSGDSHPASKAEGAGCFPAVLAATLLMGVAMFLMFGFAGYLIFQKRGDLAARTIRGTMLSELEQSRLDPETKIAVIGRLTTLADDIESKKLENWQAGGVMNRLVRAPLLRWGDLQAIDAWAQENFSEAEYEEFHKQVTRFFRAAELDRAIASDLQDILLTVTAGDPALMLGRLKTDLTKEDVREVAVRAKLVADRAEVPDRVFENVSLPKIVDRLIEVGIREGST